MMLDYIDSTILIYHYEDVGSFKIRATRWLATLSAAGDDLAISDLVRMECRVGPLRSGDRAKLAIYDGFFAQPGIWNVQLTPAVYDRAAEIRAQYRFKTPDAIHLASAIESGCDRFLTNDLRLALFKGIAVETLP